MLIQKKKGPRFFIPKRFRSNTFEYVHTFIEMQDLEASRLSDNQPDANQECVICMHNLRVEVDDNLNQVEYYSSNN